MAVHPDVQRVSSALEARQRAALQPEDAALLGGLFTDDVVWHGAASGKNEVTERWNAFAREGGPRIEVNEVYADGLHTVAVLELSDASGQKAPQAMVFHMDDDGKAKELWSMPTDQTIADAFARGEPVPEHRYFTIFRVAEETRERNTFEPQDIANINAFLREDVWWHGAGGSQWAEGVRERDNVIGLFKMFKEATGGTMHLGMEGMFADDTHAASIAHLTATRADDPDKKMDLKEVNLFHLDEKGRGFEFWGIADDQENMDAFWT